MATWLQKLVYDCLTTALKSVEIFQQSTVRVLTQPGVAMNNLPRIQPYVCLVHNQRVEFTPKLLHNNHNAERYENSGCFWKYAIFEVVLTENSIEPEYDAPRLSKVLSDLVLRQLSKAKTMHSVRVFIQIFQQVTPPAEGNGPLVYNKTEYETGWICKVHLHNDFVAKITHCFPEGFTFDLTLSDVTMSSERTSTDKQGVADIVKCGNVHATPELHSYRNEECGPTVKLSRSYRHTYSCIRVKFKMPHASELDLHPGHDFLELDRRGVLNDQTFEGTVNLQIRVDSSAELVDYDSDADETSSDEFESNKENII